MPSPRPTIPTAMLRRYHAALTLTRQGVDPLLALSLVLWPTPLIQQAERKAA